MHKVNIPTALAFAAILAAPATTSAAPKIVNVQYYSTGGGDGQTGNASMAGQQGIVASTDATPYWNQFTAGGYGWIPSSTADLTNRTLYLTDDSAGLVDSGIRLSGQRAQCSVKSNTGIPLFRGGIYAAAGNGNGDGKSITITLSGLTVGQTYDLYVYGASPIYNGNPTITVTGIAPAVKSTVFNTSTTAYSTDNTAEFTGILPASDGTLTIVASHPTLYFGINGFTLVSDSGVTPAPVMAVVGPLPSNADILDNVGTQDFGTVLVGANKELSFTLKNTGDADLTLSAPTIDGADQAAFTVTTSPTSPVTGPSGSTTLTVRFAPASLGTKSAALHIVNNDATKTPFDIALTGTCKPDLAALQQAYVDQHYGMFLHYNMMTYTGADWPGMPNMNPNTFTLTASTANPTGSIKVASDQWAATAKAAGMAYGVLTTKHHDGFALWDTDQSNYDIAATSWYNNPASPNYHVDMVQAFSDSFRAQGLNVGLYYSMWDISNGITNPPAKSAADATAYVKAELHHLLTAYGPINVLWTDGWGWEVGYTNVNYSDVYAYIKQISPNTLLMENDTLKNLVNSDIAGFEQSPLPPVGNTVPSEVCATIASDNSWFYAAGSAASLKSAATIGGQITYCNSNHCTYLLNVPPDKSGMLPANMVQRLMEIAYNSWASGLTNQAFDADPNQDGIQNGMAWIVGARGDGNAAGNLSKLPAVSHDISGALLLAFDRLKAAAPIAPLVVQYGDNLSAWTDLAVPTSGGTSTDGNLSVNVAPGAGSTSAYDRITVTIPKGYMAPHPDTFVRLKAVK